MSFTQIRLTLNLKYTYIYLRFDKTLKVKAYIYALSKIEFYTGWHCYDNVNV